MITYNGNIGNKKSKNINKVYWKMFTCTYSKDERTFLSVFPSKQRLETFDIFVEWPKTFSM